MSSTKSPRMASHDEDQLWDSYTVRGDSEARNTLIHLYMPLAKKIASSQYIKRIHDGVDYEDYYQYALVGLIESIDRYQVDKGASFETYASYRVKGAIINNLNKQTEKHEQSACRHKVTTQRVESLSNGNTLTLLDELIDIAVGLAVGYMLEGTAIVQDEDTAHMDTPYKRSVLSELREKVMEALWRVLSEKERTVVLYHYGHELTFELIADSLGLTKGRISQIHRKAIDKLREEIATDVDDYYV